jgi:hypothetical protein
MQLLMFCTGSGEKQLPQLLLKAAAAGYDIDGGLNAQR